MYKCVHGKPKWKRPRSSHSKKQQKCNSSKALSLLLEHLISMNSIKSMYTFIHCSISAQGAMPSACTGDSFTPPLSTGDLTPASFYRTPVLYSFLTYLKH